MVLPENKSDIRRFVGLYKRSGLQGYAFSFDYVYLVWGKCPAGFLVQCKGKEKFPTLSFKVVASDTKKLRHLSNYFYGATNDKTISSLDKCII